jgi:hypothetical protein
MKMRTYSVFLTILLGLIATMVDARADPSPQCDAVKTYAKLTVGSAKTKWLRGNVPLRELATSKDYETNKGNATGNIAELESAGTPDCTRKVIFPACSELQLKEDLAPDFLMTLIDTSTSATFVKQLHMTPKPTADRVHYLVSDLWGPSSTKKTITFFVYLLDEPFTQNGQISTAEIAKHYVVEAFDSDNGDCTKYRPDQKGNISKVPDGNIHVLESDTSQGHEGKP